MHVKLEAATPADAAAIAAVRLATSRELTAKFGRGTWSFAAESEGGVNIDILTSRVLVVHHLGTLVATLRLSERQPWFEKMDRFTPAKRPLYLTSMAVLPKLQGQGIGRGCLEEVRRLATEWGVDAIRLDAYDAPAGAGDFYRKAGYAEVCRAPYHGTPLIFFELLLTPPGVTVAKTDPAPAATTPG